MEIMMDLNSMEKDDEIKIDETGATVAEGDLINPLPVSLSSIPKTVGRPLPFTCTVCDKKFPKRIMLQCHERIHISVVQNSSQKKKKNQGLSKSNSLKHQKQLQLGNTPYTCEKCGKKFTISKELKRHKQIIHGEIPQTFANANLEENLKLKDKSTESRPCFSLPDKTKIQAKINMDNEERSPCEICGKILHSSSLYHHKKIHAGQPSRNRNKNAIYPKNCDICGQSFPTSTLFFNHSKTHSKEVKCQKCDKLFANKFLLGNHMKTHREKAHECDICGKKFSKKGLKTHLKIHTAAKKYSCNVCEKSFSMPVSLKEHARKHAGENPYVCDICGKTFTWSSTLKLHKSTHTEGKRYSCKICAKKFFYSSALNYHSKTHLGDKPYCCHICSKTFFQACGLTTHMKSAHSQDKEQCPICQNHFRSLKSHLRKVHKQNGSYSCQICSQKFSKSRHFISHMTTHSS